MKYTTILIFSLVLLLGSSYMNAWTAPSVSPPGGNVAAPLNTGSATQVKVGTLGLDGLGVDGNTYFDGTHLDFFFTNSVDGADTMWRMKANDNGAGNWQTYLNTEGRQNPSTPPVLASDGFAYREVYTPVQGDYQFFVSGVSGASGNAIVWDRAMQIEGDGDVLIEKLHVGQVCDQDGNNCGTSGSVSGGLECASVSGNSSSGGQQPETSVYIDDVATGLTSLGNTVAAADVARNLHRGATPVVECRADNNWTMTGCSSKTNQNGKSSMQGPNSCVGSNDGNARTVYARCCRIN